MHQGQQFRPATTLECLLYLVRGEYVTPLGLHDDWPRPAALDDIDHTAAEDAVDSDHYFIARLNQVHQTGFHAGAAGAGDRQGVGVLGLEDKSQQILGLVHQTNELRVKVPHQRCGQRPEHAGVDIARTWAKQDTSRRSKLTSSFHGRLFLRRRRETALTLPRTDRREKGGTVGRADTALLFCYKSQNTA